MAPSFRLRLLAATLRLTVRARLGDMRDLKRVHRIFDGMPIPPPPGVSFRPGTLGGVPGEWAEAGGDKPLLYIHGGGFVGCSPRTHRPMTGGFARRGFRVFAPDYRLAPAHRFPAAVEDCLASWRAFSAQMGGRAVLAGDSAGGNLALVTALQTKREAGRPAAVVAFSPATDLTGGSESWRSNRFSDAMFTDNLKNLLDFYASGPDVADPRASPLLGDLSGLPPILFHVGDGELLRDDSVRFAKAAHAAGSRAEITIWRGAPHVFQFAERFVPEARRSMDEAAAFLARALQGAEP